MTQASLVAALARRLPFYYGWVVLACVCCAGIARTGPAVATLSLFVGPMTQEFGWSRTELSGAVSLGGVLAALTAPMIGQFLDRRGPRVILSLAVATTGLTILALSGIQSLLAFYLLFCVARMNFAGPFDLGISGAVANWFLVRRPLASSISTLAGMVGLTLMPLIAFTAMQAGGWRAGWLAIGIAVLGVGFLPVWGLLVRRPEDLGLRPDGAGFEVTSAVAADQRPAAAATPEEPAYTRREAMATSTFWLLSLFTMLVYPVQAGMSLHQAAHLAECGLSAAVIVSCVTTFSVTSAFAGLFFGVVLRRIGVRVGLALSALLLCASALIMSRVASAPEALLAAGLFGAGMGGLQTGLPVAWADYFGRRSFGAIRGVALSMQVAAQAVGPLLSGVLRDWSGDYITSLLCFATLSGAAVLAAVLVRAPALVPTSLVQPGKST